MSTAAMAQEVMGPVCSGSAPSTASLTFDDSDHRRWHRRFWTGNCAGLGLFCSAGSPNWNDQADQLISRAAPADRSAIRIRVCRLGQRIGHEWAKDNSIRRINTRDLTEFYGILKDATDISLALGVVEGRTDRALNGG